MFLKIVRNHLKYKTQTEDYGQDLSLVLNTLLALVVIVFTPKAMASKAKEDLNQNHALCFEIYTGQKALGAIFELKDFEDNTHITRSFTQLKSNDKKVPYSNIQIIKSESDQYFNPIKSSFEVYSKNKLTQSITTNFQIQKNKIRISKKDKMSNSESSSEEAKGLVLYQHVIDLLFSKKKITDISPKETLVFQVYSESKGKVQQLSTQLNGQSDHLTLIHKIESSTYKTVYSSNRKMIQSHDLTKNIKLKPCSKDTMLSNLNSALSYDSFKSLFSFEDREKIKKCCQHF